MNTTNNVYPFHLRTPDDEVKKAFNRLVAQYGIAKKGACLMSDTKRAELRKKRKKKKKK